MKISDLKEEHPSIYELAMGRTQESSWDNINVKRDELDLDNAFDWDETPERSIFWLEINKRNFRPFYARYPEHAKKNDMKEEKDWSTAKDEELIAEAKRRYPVGTEFYPINSKHKCTITTSYFVVSGIGGLNEVNERGDFFTTNTDYHCVLNSDRNKWAEVVSHPKEEKTQVERKKEADVMNAFMKPSEPKAGDMVEVKMNAWEEFDTRVEEFVMLLSKEETFRYLTFCNGKYHFRDKIRLPQKSDVDEKATNVRYEIETNASSSWKDIIIEAIKWGQVNPSAK